MVKIKAEFSTSTIPYWMSQFIWVIWRANRKTAINNKTVKHSLCLWIQTLPSNSLPWLVEWRNCSHIRWQPLPVIKIVFWILNMPSWKRSVALGMAAIQPSNLGTLVFPARASSASRSYMHTLTLHVCLGGVRADCSLLFRVFPHRF